MPTPVIDPLTEKPLSAAGEPVDPTASNFSPEALAQIPNVFDPNKQKGEDYRGLPIGTEQPIETEEIDEAKEKIINT
jgi:hypothetical protein|tara:strand:+ start:681 stop:911 length:231 start_codon:yes stop_codon:yes gene_type:complete